jgi:preprotein translocase SecE subunit
VAKTRAQRKAEQRRKAAQGGDAAERDAESRAQHDTETGKTGVELEAELAERGANLDELTGREPQAPAPSRADVGRPEPEPEAAAVEEAAPADRISRRAQKQADRERKQKAKESEARRAPKAPVAEKRQRGGVLGFFASCIAELRRVQWPDRETLIQASTITVVFIAIMAAYLGVLDAVFNWLVQRIL